MDGSDKGRIFEGIGGVSAGASSRLLIDYPAPQRSQILDYLFKPNFGASLQHLKVEVGGDTNSTDGSEPSHMHTRTDENYDRGYEWWLMKEAKARNPKIILDALPWGAPGWIGNGKYYSQDMANYIVKFIQGAKKHHGLDIEYVGIWNETNYDVGYIKLLKKTLLANGLTTKIVGADLSENQWKITDDFKLDPELREDVYAIGVHYTRVKGNFYVTGSALRSGMPLWSTEDQPFLESGYNGIMLQRDWKPGARTWAKILNANYIDGKVTKTETWSPITSYYDNLAAPNSGLMYANTPWSGYYNVQAAVWVTAHTTQFAQPGWRYLDSACGYLKGKGSYVTLRDPSTSDYSIVVETVDAAEPQEVAFQIAGGLSTGAIHVWQTNASRSLEKLSDIAPAEWLVHHHAGARFDLFAHNYHGPGKRNCRTAACISVPVPLFGRLREYQNRPNSQILCGPGRGVRSCGLRRPAGTMLPAGHQPTSDHVAWHQPGSIYLSWQRGLVRLRGQHGCDARRAREHSACRPY